MITVEVENIGCETCPYNDSCWEEWGKNKLKCTELLAKLEDHPNAQPQTQKGEEGRILSFVVRTKKTKVEIEAIMALHKIKHPFFLPKISIKENKEKIIGQVQSKKEEGKNGYKH